MTSKIEKAVRNVETLRAAWYAADRDAYRGAGERKLSERAERLWGAYQKELRSTAALDARSRMPAGR